MKIYERVEKQDAPFILLEKGDAKQLLEALELACKTNKRKKIWHKLKEQLYYHLTLY